MRKILLSVSLFVFLAGPAWAITELPDPNTPIPGAPGENIATLHDDFYAYSAKLNTALGYPGFDISTGTGGLDILLYTGAMGQDNDPVQGGFAFEDPMNAPTGGVDTFSGVWGLGIGSNGPVLVDDLLSYLQTFDPDASVPVFNFDMNQDRNGADVYVAAKVSIWDPVNNQDIAFWALDGIANNAFDAPNLNNLLDAAWVKAEGVLNLGSYTANHNTGSGKLDYIAYAPSMDLSLYTGKGYQFRGEFLLAGLTGGHEELFLTGAFALADNTNSVPEPASMLLFGSGFAGVAAYRRKKARS